MKTVTKITVGILAATVLGGCNFDSDYTDQNGVARQRTVYYTPLANADVTVQCKNFNTDQWVNVYTQNVGNINRNPVGLPTYSTVFEGWQKSSITLANCRLDNDIFGYVQARFLVNGTPGPVHWGPKASRDTLNCVAAKVIGGETDHVKATLECQNQLGSVSTNNIYQAYTNLNWAGQSFYPN